MRGVMELFVEQLSFKRNKQTSLLAAASKQEILTWSFGRAGGAQGRGFAHFWSVLGASGRVCETLSVSLLASSDNL